MLSDLIWGARVFLRLRFFQDQGKERITRLGCEECEALSELPGGK